MPSSRRRPAAGPGGRGHRPAEIRSRRDRETRPGRRPARQRRRGIGLLAALGRRRRALVPADAMPEIADRAPEEERDRQGAREQHLEGHAPGGRIDIEQVEHSPGTSASVSRMLTARRRAIHHDLGAIPLHPLLAAAYPVIFLFTVNAAEQVTLGHAVASAARLGRGRRRHPRGARAPHRRLAAERAA